MSTITSTTPTAEVPAGQRIDLAIEGMTCASCAARIERRTLGMFGHGLVEETRPQHEPGHPNPHTAQQPKG